MTVTVTVEQLSLLSSSSSSSSNNIKTTTTTSSTSSSFCFLWMIRSLLVVIMIQTKPSSVQGLTAVSTSCKQKQRYSCGIRLKKILQEVLPSLYVLSTSMQTIQGGAASSRAHSLLYMTTVSSTVKDESFDTYTADTAAAAAADTAADNEDVDINLQLQSYASATNASTTSSQPTIVVAFQPPIYNKTDVENEFIQSLLEANFLFQDILNQEDENQRQQQQDLESDNDDKTGDTERKRTTSSSSGSTTTTTTTSNNTDTSSNNNNEIDKIMFMNNVNDNLVDIDNNQDKNDLNKQKEKKRKNLSRLVSAFEKYEYKKGSILCQQGDSPADYLHIIYKGDCSVYIDNKQLPQPYGVMSKGSMIGELGLINESPRLATVIAETNVIVFRLDYESFQYFLYQSNSNNNSYNDNNNNSNDAVEAKKQELQNQIREIDSAIDQIAGVRSKYNGDIIQPFKPIRSWLWRRWRGTILQHAWKAATMNMILSVVFIATMRHFVRPTWAVGAIPDTSNPVISRFTGLSKLWHYLMNITTFILTFFLSQAYSLWRDLYNAGRKVQGRMNDIGMLLATTAERERNTKQYTARAANFLDDIAVYCRLYHALSWANYCKKFAILLTPRGLSRMCSRGVMTREQYDVLVSIRPNLCGPHYACLMWILTRSLQAMKEGILPNEDSIRRTLIDKLLTLRGVQAGMGDSLDGRIPLAYAHFVQCLVDSFLILAPFALYTELGVWSVPAVGLLTLFYSGLLDLSKILLDPLDNDAEFYEDSSVNMDIGVLIRESNSGSNRWKNGLETLPF